MWLLPLPVWVGHSCPTPLTLGLGLFLLLQLPVWVGHSCPTPLTLGVEVVLAVEVGVALCGSDTPVGRSTLAVEVDPYHELNARDNFGAYTRKLRLVPRHLCHIGKSRHHRFGRGNFSAQTAEPARITRKVLESQHSDSRVTQSIL